MADRAVRDVKWNAEKAGRDVSNQLKRDATNAEDAGKAIVAYANNKAQGLGEQTRDALTRVREGKIIDAIWHASIAPYVVEDKAASRAMLDSSVLRTVGQVTASAYGGPSGSAAFAAWLTYHQTGGNVEAAIRAGVITGASSAVNSLNNSVPSETLYDTMKKSIVSSAVAGASAAAMGASDKQVQEMMMMAAGTTLLQDGYSVVTKKSITGDASGEGSTMRGATKGALCIQPEMVAGQSINGCAGPPKDAFVMKRDGSGYETYENNMPVIDPSKVDTDVSQVGIQGGLTTKGMDGSAVMIGVGKVPGMNGMAIFHDKWMMEWRDLNPAVTQNSVFVAATILPATVLTYWASGAPLYEQLRVVGMEGPSKELVRKSEISAIGERLNGAAPLPGAKPLELDNGLPEGTWMPRYTWLCATETEHRVVNLITEMSTGSCQVLLSRGQHRSGAYGVVPSSVEECTKVAAELLTSLGSSGFKCAVSSMAPSIVGR